MPADDLKNLREEYQESAKHLSRVAWVSLAILVICIAGFGRAFSRIDDAELRRRLTDIWALGGGEAGDPDVSYVFELAWRNVSHSEEKSGAQRSASSSEAALDNAVNDLEALAKSWFTAKFSLIGSDLEVDLRYWIGILPLLLWGSSAYLSILRARLEVLARIGAHLVVNPHSDAGPVEVLLFGRSPEPPYARYPARLGFRVYVIAIASLMTYLLIVGAPLWSLWEIDAVSSAMFDSRLSTAFLAALISYSLAAYVWYARMRLHEEADAITGEIHLPTLPERTYRWLTMIGRQVAEVSRRTPKPSIGLGSAMVILSLLTTFATSCDGPHRKGYELFILSSQARWFTAPADFFDITESLLPFLGQIYYAASLLTAVAALVVVAVSFFRGSFGWSKAVRWLRPALLLGSLFMLVEVGFVFPMAFPGLNDFIRIVYFVIPAYLWIRFGLSRRAERLERWRTRIRPFINVMLLPAVISVPMALWQLHHVGLWGVPLFFVGLETAGLACMSANHAAQADSVTPPRSRP